MPLAQLMHHLCLLDSTNPLYVSWQAKHTSVVMLPSTAWVLGNVKGGTVQAPGRCKPAAGTDIQLVAALTRLSSPCMWCTTVPPCWMW